MDMASDGQMGKFVGYVGGPELHDATILKYSHAGEEASVQLKSDTGHQFTVSFSGVREVSANCPELMIIYAIAELEDKLPYRSYVFVNWDEKDQRILRVVAQYCSISS
jgi:hypothetical protein